MTTNQMDTYNSSATNDRDVNAIVYNVSPKDSPLYSMIKETSAVARFKENVSDVTAGGTAINALSEGDTLSAAAVTPRTIAGNYLQILTTTISVSGTQEEVAKYGGVNSEIEYQVKNKFIELAKDVEYSMINGTSTAGVSGTGSANARKMGGLKTLITTNTATASGDAATGTAFEDTINDLFQTMFETGQIPDTVLVGGTVKRRISALTQNVTRNVEAEKKMQINSINIYDSDFGTVNIVLDRYVDSTLLFAIDKKHLETAYLRKFRRIPLAKVADSTEVSIVGEATLDMKTEKAGGKIVFS